MNIHGFELGDDLVDYLVLADYLEERGQDVSRLRWWLAVRPEAVAVMDWGGVARWTDSRRYSVRAPWVRRLGCALLAVETFQRRPVSRDLYDCLRAAELHAFGLLPDGRLADAHRRARGIARDTCESAAFYAAAEVAAFYFSQTTVLSFLNCWHGGGSVFAAACGLFRFLSVDSLWPATQCRGPSLRPGVPATVPLP